MDGTHIRGTALRDSTTGRTEVLRIEIWPIDEDLMQMLYEVIRYTLNRKLTELDISNGAMTDLTAKGSS